MCVYVISSSSTWPKSTNRLSHFSSFRRVFDQLYMHSEIKKRGCFHQSTTKNGCGDVIWLFLRYTNLRGFLLLKRGSKMIWWEQWNGVLASCGGWALWWVFVKFPLGVFYTDWCNKITTRIIQAFVLIIVIIFSKNKAYFTAQCYFKILLWWSFSLFCIIMIYTLNDVQ